MRGADTNLAGARVRLKADGILVTGVVRAAWLEPANLPPEIVLLIEIHEAAGGVVPAELGEVRLFRYQTNGIHKLIVLHEDVDPREARRIAQDKRHG